MTCKKCPLGNKCSVKETSAPLPCLNGTYANETASQDCKICPAGYSCLDPKQTPVLCSPGFYSPSGIPQCLLCPSGHRYVRTCFYRFFIDLETKQFLRCTFRTVYVIKSSGRQTIDKYSFILRYTRWLGVNSS